MSRTEMIVEGITLLALWISIITWRHDRKVLLYRIKELEDNYEP
jgi:hypothetical protein